MAKTASKSAAKEPRKAAAKTVKAKSLSIDAASEEALKKLQTLGIELPLQNDLEWCLGSYRADGNPAGLYIMVERAVDILRSEQAKKTKGVTAKLVNDLQKAIENR